MPELLWKYSAHQAVHQLLVDDGDCFCTARRTRLVALRARTGEERWSARIENSAIDAATLLELTSSANLWYLTDPGVQRHQVSLAAAYPLTLAIWVQLKYDYARKPPAFGREETVVLAVGVKR